MRKVLLVSLFVLISGLLSGFRRGGNGPLRLDEIHPLIRKEEYPRCKAGSAVKKKGAFSTPWRYVMIADHPAKLLENSYFVIDMNKPNRLQDVSRIKPGKVI